MHEHEPILTSVCRPAPLRTLIKIGGAVMAVTTVGMIVVPQYLNSIQRGAMKRTMSDLRVIGTAVESYQIDGGDGQGPDTESRSDRMSSR